MRTTIPTALALLSLASPLLALPLPTLDPHYHAISASYPHRLPINVPHTPISSFPPSIWTGRPCHVHDRIGREGGGSMAADNFVPQEFKDLIDHSSSPQASNYEVVPELDEGDRSWMIIQYPVTHRKVTRAGNGVFSEDTLEYILWTLSGCLVVAFGLKMVSLWIGRPDSETEDSEKGHGEGESKTEKDALSLQVFEEREDDDTDVDENGMDRSSW